MKGVKHIESALEVSACRIEHSSNVPGNISAPLIVPVLMHLISPSNSCLIFCDENIPP